MRQHIFLVLCWVLTELASAQLGRKSDDLESVLERLEQQAADEEAAAEQRPTEARAAVRAPAVEFSPSSESFVPTEPSAGHFNYGENWHRFVDASLTGHALSGIKPEGRAHYMARALLANFGLSSFEGLSFLDIGCGSGLASLAALMLGARRIISVDAQIASVQATQVMREKYLGRRGAPDAEWQVWQGSILDDHFVESLTPSYLVYSYGVLHVTTDVWAGLGNIAKLVAHEGLLFVAVHSRELDDRGESEQWLPFKQNFNQWPAWMQEHHLLAWLLSELSEPVRKCLDEHPKGQMIPGSFTRFSAVSFCLTQRFHQFSGGRGMDFITDARDWLGGYPYAWLAADDVIRFFASKGLKTIQVDHEAIVGFLLTPAESGSIHYWNARHEHGTGHWWSRSLFTIPPSALLPWSEYVSLLEGPKGVCAGRLGGLEVCGAQERVFKEVAQQAVQGSRCFAYIFPDRELVWNATLRSHFEVDSVLLEDMDILGWGTPSTDGRFCAEGGGARFRIFGAGLVVFSNWDDTDPRSSGRLYQVLLSPLYSVSFADMR